MDAPGWGSSEDEGPMEIDLDARQEENNASKPNVPEADPEDYDPAMPTDDLENNKDGGKNMEEGEVLDNISDYDPADPTLSEDELDKNEETNRQTDNSIAETGQCEDEEGNSSLRERKGVFDGEEEEENDGRWNSQMFSSQEAAADNNDSTHLENNSFTDQTREEISGDNEEDLDVEWRLRNDLVENEKTRGNVAPVDQDDNSQTSAISETEKNANQDDGLSDVPDVQFDDSDFVLEKETFGEKANGKDEEESDAPNNDKFGWENDEERKESKSSHRQKEKEEEDEEERERKRREEVAHRNEEALVNLFREESEPDHELVEGDVSEQHVKKTKKKVVSKKKEKKKIKKVKKGQSKKGADKVQGLDPGDQRFVELSGRPSVDSQEDGEIERGSSRRGSNEEKDTEREGRSFHEENELREPGEIVESEGKKKGTKKKDKKEKKKKKSKREVATVEEGANDGDDDSQKFPSFLAGFFVQDGIEDLEDGQEAFANEVDEEDPRSLFAKASGDKSHRSRGEDSDNESASDFQQRQRHDNKGDDNLEEEEHWRNRRQEERRHESREARKESHERRHGSRERREKDRRVEEESVDRERERSRSQRGGRGRDRERERERDRERERSGRSRRSGEERQRRGSRSRSRERRKRSASRERSRRSRSRERMLRHRRRSLDRSAERDRERDRERAEREREIEKERAKRRRQRSRERRMIIRARRESRSRSRSPMRRSERAGSDKENRDGSRRRRRDRGHQSEESESEARESIRRSQRHSSRRDRHARSSSASDNEHSSSSSSSSSSPSGSNRHSSSSRLPQLSFQYSDDEGNSSDVILVEPERIVIDLEDDEDPPSRVDITHGNNGRDEYLTLADGQNIPPPSEMSTRPRGSALVEINPENEDQDTRVVVQAEDDAGDATPTRDEVSDIETAQTISTPHVEAELPKEPPRRVRESDYDPAHPTDEDAEDNNRQEPTISPPQQVPQETEPHQDQQAGSPVPTLTQFRNPSPPPTEKGPVPPDHPPPEEVRPSPPPIPAEAELTVPPHQQQSQPLPPGLPGLMTNNPVLQLINPLLMQHKQQMALGNRPMGNMLPPRMAGHRFPWGVNQGNRDSGDVGLPPHGFHQGPQRHIRPLMQMMDNSRGGPSFGRQDSSPRMPPFGPMGQQPPPGNIILEQANNIRGPHPEQLNNMRGLPNNMHPDQLNNMHSQQLMNNMQARMPLAAMQPLAQLTSLLPALEKAKVAARQQEMSSRPVQGQEMSSRPVQGMFNHKQLQQPPPSLLGKPPLSTSSASNLRGRRQDHSETTEVVDMDMSPEDDDCELELPSPRSDSSKEGHGKRRSRRGQQSRGGGNSGGTQDKPSVAKGPIQPVAYLKALSKALEKLDPKTQQSGQAASDKGGKSAGSSKKHSKKVDLEDDVPASAVDLTNKEKYLKKLHLQERVIEEVKLAIKPFYSAKKINKEQYKLILRKAVPKVCHSKAGHINPQRIQQLVEAYVSKSAKKHSGGGPGPKKKSKGAKEGGQPQAKEGGAGGSGITNAVAKQNGERSKKAAVASR